MGSLGGSEYPDVTLDTAIEYASKSFRVLSEGIDRIGLAQALNLKIGTGGFARALSSLKRYGLIEGHGTFKRTSLADQIIHGFTQEDKDKARAEAWLKVELIRELYQRYRTSIPEGDGEFLAFLGKLTGAGPSDVQSKAEFLRDLIGEAVKDLKVIDRPLTTSTETNTGASSFEQPVTPVTPSGFLDAKVGDVYIRIPRSPEGLQMAQKLLELLGLQVTQGE